MKSSIIITMFAILSVSEFSFAQQPADLNWDVRINRTQWNSISADEQAVISDGFRELGILRGEGRVIPDLDENAIKIRGGFSGSGIELELTTPDECRTSDGRTYIKGEIRNTGQRCTCGWFSCWWADSDQEDGNQAVRDDIRTLLEMFMQ